MNPTLSPRTTITPAVTTQRAGAKPDWTFLSNHKAGLELIGLP